MGYETKMYVVTPYHGRSETVILIEGNPSAYTIYNDNDGKGEFFFLGDGNTKRYVSGLKRSKKEFKKVEIITCGVIAMVDLCKASYGQMQGIIGMGHQDTAPFGAFYASDGNSLIVEDHYGHTMSFVDIPDVIHAMEQDQKENQYRRFNIALAMLEQVKEHFKDKAKILFYGH